MDIYGSDISFQGGDSVVCSGLQNGDLPNAIGSLSGHHVRLSVGGSPNLTILRANSFPGLSFDYVMLYPVNLETIESGFLQGGSTKELWMMGCSKLRFDILVYYSYLEKL